MNNHLPDIRNSIDDYFSDMDERPSLQYRVLAQTRGEVKVKKKLSIGMVLIIVMVLAVATALAATLLSSKEFVTQVLSPMAQENTSSKWTKEQTDEIIRQAEKNGIVLPENILQRLEQTGEGYKEELMRAFAKMELGVYPASWSLADQAWYDELLVQCGLRDERTRFLPTGNEISEETALTIAIQYTLDYFDKTAAPFSSDRYARYVQYMRSEDNQGNAVKMWDIEFEAIDDGAAFYICILSDGTVLKDDSYMKEATRATAPSDESEQGIDWLCRAITDNSFFSVQNMAQFKTKYGSLIDSMGDLQGTKYSVLRNLCTIPYGTPTETDISQEEAFQQGKTAVIQYGWTEEWLARCKYTVSYRVYDPASPEWRICFKIDGGTTGENYAYFHRGEMPFGIVVNLDARNGVVLSIKQLDEMDRYDYYCEFPDERDETNTLIYGVG